MPPVKQRRRTTRQPKQQRSKAMVAALTIAGARILAREGWAGFTTNAVAERAGVSIGSFYEFFRDTQALVDAIADAHVAQGERLLEHAVGLVARPPALSELVEVLVEGAIALHADDPDLHSVLSSQVPLSPRIHKRVARLRSELADLVSHALQGQVARPRLVAQLLVDVTDAIVHRWWVEDDGRTGDPRVLASELKTMLGAYLKHAR